MRTIITRRRSAVGLALCGLALVVAGCGSAGPSSSTGANSPPPKNFASDAYKFSACMRTHGVSNFPDPVVNSSPGHQSIAIRITPGTGSSPAFASAQKACRGILPMPKNGGTQQQSHASLADELSFARCIRSRGFSQFPDPDAQGQLTPQSVQAAGVDMQAPAFRTAALACVPASHGALTDAMVEQAIAHPDGGSSTGTATGAAPGGG